MIVTVRFPAKTISSPRPSRQAMTCVVISLPFFRCFAQKSVTLGGARLVKRSEKRSLVERQTNREITLFLYHQRANRSM
jgi:hypothetical protein